jgi:hypothetical protein
VCFDCVFYYFKDITELYKSPTKKILFKSISIDFWGSRYRVCKFHIVVLSVWIDFYQCSCILLFISRMAPYCHAIVAPPRHDTVAIEVLSVPVPWRVKQRLKSDNRKQAGRFLIDHGSHYDKFVALIKEQMAAAKKEQVGDSSGKEEIDETLQSWIDFVYHKEYWCPDEAMEDWISQETDRKFNEMKTTITASDNPAQGYAASAAALKQVAQELKWSEWHTEINATVEQVRNKRNEVSSREEEASSTEEEAHRRKKRKKRATALAEAAWVQSGGMKSDEVQGEGMEADDVVEPQADEVQGEAMNVEADDVVEPKADEVQAEGMDVVANDVVEPNADEVQRRLTLWNQMRNADVGGGKGVVANPQESHQRRKRPTIGKHVAQLINALSADEVAEPKADEVQGGGMGVEANDAVEPKADVGVDGEEHVSIWGALYDNREFQMWRQQRAYSAQVAAHSACTAGNCSKSSVEVEMEAAIVKERVEVEMAMEAGGQPGDEPASCTRKKPLFDRAVARQRILAAMKRSDDAERKSQRTEEDEPLALMDATEAEAPENQEADQPEADQPDKPNEPEIFQNIDNIEDVRTRIFMRLGIGVHKSTPNPSLHSISISILQLCQKPPKYSKE